MLPSPDILNEFELGKFVLSNLAAKRAKQLREGARPLVAVDSNHPLTIALAEIAAGKIKAIMPTASDAIDSVTVDLPILVDEKDLGLLLPALDETEVVLVGGPIDDHDHDPDVDADSEPAHDREESETISLADLVEPDEEEEVAHAEDDTLSLTDIAEQETTLEDGESDD